MKTVIRSLVAKPCVAKSFAVVVAAFAVGAAQNANAQNAVPPDATPNPTVSTPQSATRDAALLEAVRAIATKKFVARKSLQASDWDAVRKALDSGASARYADDVGSTTLMLAAFNLPFADDATLQRIVARADLNAQDSAGSTALHIAAREGYFKMVRLLVKAGAKLDLTDKEGQTPLDLADKYSRGLAGFILTQARAKNAADLKTPTATSSTRTPISGAAKIADARLYYALDDLHLGDISEKKMIGASLGSENQYWTEVQEALRDGAPVRFTVHYGGITSLMLAAFGIPGADDGVVKQIIARAELNAQDKSSQTALHIASSYNNLKMVGWLIDAGAELNLVDRNNKTALDWAQLEKRIGKGSDAVIALLEKAGAKTFAELKIPGASVPKPSTPAAPKTTTPSTAASPSTSQPTANDRELFGAIEEIDDNYEEVTEEDWDVVRKLLDGGATGRYADAFGVTALMIIAGSSQDIDDAIAQKILARSNVNAQNYAQRTALHMAAEWANAKMVGWLIKAGADLNVLTINNQTPLDLAVAKKFENIISLLKDAGAKTSAQLLSNASIPTPSTQSSSPTPGNSSNTSSNNSSTKTAPAKNYNRALDADLVAAVSDNDIKQVRQLLTRNADPNARDTDKNATPVLCSAAGDGYMEIVRALVEAGADLEATNLQGNAPLVFAALDNRTDAISYLLQKGANIEGNKFKGMTALMIAASGNTESVRLLIASGANVNARSKANGTSLHYGSTSNDDGSGNLEIIKMLVEAGADVSVKSDSGKFAPEIAVDNKLYDIESYLVDIYNRDLALFSVTAKANREFKTATTNTRLANWQLIKDELAKGANPRFANDDGFTTLINLVSAFGALIETLNDDDVTMKTIIARSDLNAQVKEDGFTALHAAVTNYHTKLVGQLIKAGANVNIWNAKNETPLDWALADESDDIIDLLESAGAKTYAELK